MITEPAVRVGSGGRGGLRVRRTHAITNTTSSSAQQWLQLSRGRLSCLDSSTGRSKGGLVLTERMAQIQQALIATRSVAILRGAFTWDDVAVTAEALLETGFTALEYTWNSPNAAEVVARLNEEFGPDLIVGAGTLLSPADVQEAATAGARFLITPHWSADVSDAARAADLLLLPGVFTPSEVQAARSHGWRLLKLFPANVGGPGHLKALKGPFHDVDFVPTGGLNLDNAGSYLTAGAVAVALGSSLFQPGLKRADLTGRLRKLRAVLEAEPTVASRQGSPV